MKTYNKVLLGAAMIFSTLSCEEGIDPISAVEPGPDTAAPTVTIANPTSGRLLIPFTENATDLDIQFTVADDIEIQNISLKLDGTEVQSYTDFKDYRKAVNSYLYDNLPVGNHTIEVTAQDIAGKATSASVAFEITNIYQPKLPSEIFYMPFEGGTYLDLLNQITATPVGTPGFAQGKSGNAYAGAAGSYITIPTATLAGPEFSATFWYKLNGTPDRSGIMTISPPDPTNNNRNSGFRLFREATGAGQTLKLNVGTGAAENWFDGGPAASISPTSTEWAHVAFTISPTEVVVYLNGEVASTGPYPGISWANTSSLTVGSGAPNFTEWGHLSDLSLIDELRIYNKALTLEEVQTTMTE